jgi:CRP-like cAMP-binding protein
MVYLMAGSAYARLITEVLITAKRFGERKANDSIVSSLSETDLAMRAGLTRETVSREMKRLKEKGLVEVRRNEIMVPDLAKLEEELAGDF